MKARRKAHKPRPRGRPPISGERMVSRSLGLPAWQWDKYDAEARRRSVKEKRDVSTAEIIRERLSIAEGREGG